MEPVALHERNWVALWEARAEAVHRVGANRLREVVEKRPHDKLLRLAQGVGTLDAVDLRDAGRKIEPAVRRKPPEDRFGARRLKTGPRRDVLHFAASSRSFSASVIMPADARAAAAFSPSSKRNTRTAFSPRWNANA